MNEDLRAQVVEQFKKLNLEYNLELQHTIAFAAKLCKTPVAFITLSGKNNESLKIQQGLTADTIPSELSLCIQEIKKNKILIIRDTNNHPRLCSQPAVINGNKVRFYIAAPLITHQNYRIGTLCVVDFKPHEITYQEKLIFKILARHVMSVMELKLSLDLLDKNFNELKHERETRLSNEIKLRSMFESLTDAYFLLNKNGELIDFNRAAFELIERIYEKKLTYGYVLKDIIIDNYKSDFSAYTTRALKGEKIQLERLADYGYKGKIWWDCTFDPVKNLNGEIMGVSYVARNINERKLNEEKIIEQNRLLTRIAEIQSHDYRGPVASIIGLMNLIENDDYTASKDYLKMMQKAVNQLDEKIHEVVGIVTTID